MADSTINYGFPYPTGGDRVAVHSDIEKVAKAVDARVASVAGDLGTRTVSLNENGDPYLDPATGTHFILSDSSGTPYISRSIAPTFTLS